MKEALWPVAREFSKPIDTTLRDMTTKLEGSV
jgi:hypothetical protein